MAEQQGGDLIALATRFGVALSNDQREGLERFMSLLVQWNARINLTGASGRNELVAEHLPDSFAMVRLVPQGATLLDVGSGGGLAAIPFAILRPDIELTLVEPRQKRVAFLRTAVRERGLAGVRVEAARLDALRLGAVEVAASRATFPPAEWLDVARPWLVPGGRALVFAARPADVASPAEYALADEVSYRTGAGHPRWLAAFVPRGTPAAGHGRAGAG